MRSGKNFFRIVVVYKTDVFPSLSYAMGRWGRSSWGVSKKLVKEKGFVGILSLIIFVIVGDGVGGLFSNPPGPSPVGPYSMYVLVLCPHKKLGSEEAIARAPRDQKLIGKGFHFQEK